MSDADVTPAPIGAGRPGTTTWLAVAVVLVMAAAGLGGRPLWEPDEGRYVAVALEMLRSGDWLHPALHHEHPHYTKPPLTYWAIAASIGIFGPHEWAARLPNGLAFIGAALGVAMLARRVAPGRAAVCAMVYATAAMPFIAHQIITTDTLLTLFTTAGVTLFVYGWRPGRAYRRRWMDAMWMAFGMGFLTKGPPSLLPLAAVLGVVLVHDGPGGLRRLLSPVGVTLFLAIGGGWFGLVILQKPELAGYFLHDEFINRIASDMHDRNAEWYMAMMYPVLLVAGMLPWAIGWFRQPEWWRPAWLVRWMHDPLLSLMLLWIGLSLTVFMVSSSRLPLYVLPLFPALAVCTGRIMPPSFPHDRGAWASLAATVGIMLLITAVGAVIESPKDARRMTTELRLTPGLAEVVYVDRNPVYGVSFYSGLSVEEVALLNEARRGAHSFAEELDEREGRLAFVIGTDKAHALRQALRDGQWRIIDEIAYRNKVRIIAEPGSSPESGDRSG